MVSDPTATGLERLSTLHGVFYAATDDLITRQLIEFGAHTRNELAMVLDHVREGETFVDLGAHIGTFAIPIARKLGPRGKLLAIDGSPDTHALLERNVGANGLAHRIQTICAIAGHGPAQHLQRVEVGHNTGAGFYISDGTSASAYRSIDTRWLICAHGFARLDFLKIDIEGMESLVLQSVAPLLEAQRPKLYIEVVAEQLARFGATVAELDRFLRGFGYRFLRNTGDRNSVNDAYVKTELTSLERGGAFFDLLALPK
jgi:FkbM family methyltransferase